MSEEQIDEKVTHAGIVLGIGFGGLIDSFMLHMILQWHHMLSNIIPPDSMENMHRLMTADGMFDAFNFLIILLGVFLLWRAAYNRYSIPTLLAFVGQLIFGAGAFNLVEGIIDHHLLAIHYVRQVPNYAVYNWTFLAVGGVLPLLIGWMLMKFGRRLTDMVGHT
jgi:uncharacterized membrane protein